MESKHFKNHELQCHCGCGRNEIDAEALRRLEHVRVLCDFPLILSSAYRCPEHDAALGGKGNHSSGMAFDVRCIGGQAMEVVRAAMIAGFAGIGISQKGPAAGRFVHIDMMQESETRPRPWIWSY